MSFNFNALFPDANDTDVELNTKRYANKICELFDYWMSDNRKIIINPFIQIIESFLNSEHRVPACHWSKDCSKDFCAIDTNGDLYPCEHWVGNKDFCFGNIENGLISEIKKSNYFSNREVQLKKEDCKNCEIWEMCYGGCPWNGYTLFGNPNRKDSSICLGRKMIIKHIKQFLIDNGRI